MKQQMITVHETMNGLDIHNKQTKLLVGGHWDNGLHTGVSYVNANNESSNSNQNIGAQLAWIKVGAIPTIQTVCLFLLERVKHIAQEGGE